MPAPATPRFDALLEFAHLLADRSADAILPHFRRRIDVENKNPQGDFDPVTAADRGAERVISKLLETAWPSHGLVGEEFGTRGAGARYRWIIDPIDGTRSFITGSPMWGTLIGLMDGDAAMLGMMNQPYTRERFWSGRRSSHMRGADGKVRRLATRACQRLADATLMTTHPDLFAGADQQAFLRVKSHVRMTRFGGDCYAYCLLASGFVDLIIEAGLKPYDIVALIPLIERAGGRVTTWEGKPATSGGRVVASGDAKLHDAALALLAGRKA